MSQSGIYSENKLIWWYAREQGLPSAPKQVQLILSALCNQDCNFCAYRMSGYTSNELFTEGAELAKFGHNNPKRWMDTDRALALLDEIKAAGCLSVQFTGGGEPTVHPDHEKIFEKALSLGLRCSLVSNGVRWSDYLTRELLPQFDWVRMSIDAAKSYSYMETRRTRLSHWETAWNNVLALVDAIQFHKSHTVFGLGFVVTPKSWMEIPEFARKARAAGVHNVRYTAMFSNDDEVPFVPIYDRIKVMLDEARQNENEIFKVYDNFGSRFADLKQHSPDYPSCGYQHYTTYIGDDLRVYRCCVLAYNKRGLVQGGDLRERRFDEFWASEQRRADMAQLDARKCERCQFNEKNRSLLYVMGNTESDTTSRHIEWP